MLARFPACHIYVFAFGLITRDHDWREAMMHGLSVKRSGRKLVCQVVVPATGFAHFGHLFWREAVDRTDLYSVFFESGLFGFQMVGERLNKYW